MKFTPLNDRILVKRTDGAEKSVGGLFIPDSAKEKPMEAVVVAVGAGKVLKDGSRRACGIQAGDKILFGKYAGDEVKLDGEDHLILREDEILAVYED